MLKCKKSIRTIRRISLFAVVGGTLLSSTAFEPAQTRIVSAEIQETNSSAIETVARVGGTTWAQQTSNTANNLFSVHFVSETLGWAVGSNNTILNTTNGGANWTAQTNQSGVTVSSYLGVRFLDANTGWAGGGSAVVRTTNGGANWTSQGPTQDGRFRNNLFTVSPTVAWIPANNATSTSRWFSRFTVGVGEENFNVVGGSSQYFDIFFTDANNGWAVGTGPIVRITNGSTATPTFGFQTACPCPTLNGIFMLDSSTGWAVGNGGVILKTTNGGTTWPAQTSNTTANLRSIHFVDANQGWAVGNGGVIVRSTDGGATWTPETSTVTADLRRVFFVNANTGYAVGHNGTIVKRGLTATPTPTPTPTATPTATPTPTPTPTPSPTPAGFEADVAPRAVGDGIVLSTDVTQLRRFVTGLDTPAVSPNEFQRADCAPLASFGDGAITAGDVVQGRRYVTGLDPQAAAAGPTGPAAVPAGVSDFFGDVYAYLFGRRMTIRHADSKDGLTVSLPIEMERKGDEAAVSFTLEYDAERFSNPHLELGDAVGDEAVLTVNANEKGRIAVLVDSGTAWAAAKGAKSVVVVTFDVVGDEAVSFGGSISEISVSDAFGNPLAVRWVDMK
jgi:photosystem II stability/assembly factor-like uncharacterized protein